MRESSAVPATHPLPTRVNSRTGNLWKEGWGSAHGRTHFSTYHNTRRAREPCPADACIPSATQLHHVYDPCSAHDGVVASQQATNGQQEEEDVGEGGVWGQGCKAPHPYSPQQRHACRHSQATPTCTANRYVRSKSESWATLVTQKQQTLHTPSLSKDL